MSGKQSVTAWRRVTQDNTPTVNTDGDLLNVLRRLADKYRQRAEYLGNLALNTGLAGIARGAVQYAEAAQRTEALINA